MIQIQNFWLIFVSFIPDAMNWFYLLMVGTGGFAGSVARYVVARSIDLKVSSLIPFGTLLVNVLGSFILGLVFAFTFKKPAEFETWRLLLGVGFCGGFTTFSTFALENLQLFQQKHFTEFLIYTTASLLLCLLGTGLGVWMGNKVW